MGRKHKYSKEIKLQAISDYEKGIKSITQLCNELDCTGKSIWAWIYGYRSQGEDFFDNKTVNKRYSKELKLKVVTEYLSNNSSLLDLVNKYKLSSKELVRNWILRYDKGEEIKGYDPKPEVYKMKTRKVTFEKNGNSKILP